VEERVKNLLYVQHIYLIHSKLFL